jgi:hypothetical protein
MILAMAANALQIFVFPLFFEGVLSPADDVLDLAVAAALVRLLGWHWELLPAFAAELVPGVDLVPVWTLVVASAYRNWKQFTVNEPARFALLGEALVSIIPLWSRPAQVFRASPTPE